MSCRVGVRLGLFFLPRLTAFFAINLRTRLLQLSTIDKLLSYCADEGVVRVWDASGLSILGGGLSMLGLARDPCLKTISVGKRPKTGGGPAEKRKEARIQWAADGKSAMLRYGTSETTKIPLDGIK